MKSKELIYVQSHRILTFCTIIHEIISVTMICWHNFILSTDIQNSSVNRRLCCTISFKAYLKKSPTSIPLNLSPTNVLLLATNKTLHFYHCCVLTNLYQRQNGIENTYQWVWYIDHFQYSVSQQIYLSSKLAGLWK
jgi:hypothetical protein